MGKKIAITGGIGSGKSSVLRILEKNGYPIFSCDEIYKEVIFLQEYIQKVAKMFPSCVENNNINREKLSEIIFQDEEARCKLNNIAHPFIMERLMECMNENLESEFVFAEVPLLFEGGFEKLFDASIVIMRNEEERVQAVMLRDHCSREKALQRIHVQYKYEFLAKDKNLKKNNIFILNNYGDFSCLEKELIRLIKAL